MKRRQTTIAIAAIVGVAVVIVIALVVAIVVGGGGSPKPATQAETATVVAGVTGVPESVWAAVGRGTAKSLPKAVDPATPATPPQVLYIGAEYCPYCAAERWALVQALSRFGSFQGLGLTHSSATDIFPSTPTFTFHGSTYSSSYLQFVAVETATNQLDGRGGYKALDTPTADQQATWRRLDPQLSIPFVDLGGRYVVVGATFDPSVLQGKSAQVIGTSLTDPSNALTQAIVGTANTLVAAICASTGNQPAAVCDNATIRAALT